MSIQQYSKDVPPGWRPRSYPLKQFRESLSIWSKLTTLPAEKVGPAIVSRLEGEAYKIAMGLQHARKRPTDGIDELFIGLDAVVLPAQPAVLGPTGVEIIPAYPSGCKCLIDKLTQVFGFDDQDEAWMALDKFFLCIRKYNQGFSSFVTEWERYLGEAEIRAGLYLNEVAKCWLFFSRAGLTEKQMSDLKLKVDGDLSRFRDMIRLHLKVSKNEEAITDAGRGYPNQGFYQKDGVEFSEPWKEDAYNSFYSGMFGSGTQGVYFDGETWWDWDSLEMDRQADWDAWHANGGQDPEYPIDEWYYDEYNDCYQRHDAYWGKKGKKGSKGKPSGKPGGGGKQQTGSQCTNCGSKWHSDGQCPMPKDSNKDGVKKDGVNAATTVESPDEGSSEWYGDSDWWYYDNPMDTYYGDGGKKGKGKFKGARWQPNPWWKGKGKFKGKSKGKSKGKGKKFGQPWGKSSPYSGKSYYGDGYDYSDQDYLATAGAGNSTLAATHEDGAKYSTREDGVDYSTPVKPKDASTGLQLGSFSPNEDAFWESPKDTTNVSWPSTNSSQTIVEEGPTFHSDLTKPQVFQLSPTRKTAFDDDPVPVARWETKAETPGNADYQSPDRFARHSISTELPFTPEAREAHAKMSPKTSTTFVISCSIFLDSAEKKTPREQYHSVRGQHVHGLLIDPGACKGLIGSESLRELFEGILKPAGKLSSIVWRGSSATFSGISSTSESSLGLCSFELGLPGIADARFETDVIGGDSSLCPGLVPLISLINAKCFISFGYYRNGNGLLGMRIGKVLAAIQLLLTDSGHYLMPIGCFRPNPKWPGNVSAEDHKFLHKVVGKEISQGQQTIFHMDKSITEQEQDQEDIDSRVAGFRDSLKVTRTITFAEDDKPVALTSSSSGVNETSRASKAFQ